MSKPEYIDAGPATPDAPMRDWACNRCTYSWNGAENIWCPSCGHEATHGKAFASVPSVSSVGNSSEGGRT